MSDLPIKSTLKAGKDFDAPWITVDASDPDDLAFKLKGLAESDALQAVVEAANLLKAANNAAPLVAGGAEAAPQAPVQQQQPAGWGNSAPAAAPAWSGAQQQAAPSGVRQHPEGVQCPVDGNVVQFKEITSKKNGKTYSMWTCPNQRSRGDGHFSEFVS